jgi:hypothetical protein
VGEEENRGNWQKYRARERENNGNTKMWRRLITRIRSGGGETGIQIRVDNQGGGTL